MTRTYVVQMPKAEARHLAGAGPGWPATPEARCVAALREWLAGLSRRRTTTVPVRKVITELTLILSIAPAVRAPARGPFGPRRGGASLPGHVEYLGEGTVRLDETAISSLAALPPGEDFRVSFTGAGPVLEVGTDTYPARVEEPSPASQDA